MWLRVPAVLLVCFIAACVTVNIYFPAAEVKKTADEIVDDVYGEQNDTSPNPGDSSSLRRFLALIGPETAYAQKATTVSNAAIRGLKAQIAKRHKKLKRFYAAGVVGITRDGYLTIRDKSGLSLSELGTVRSLVQKDNEARRQLYKEVARALDLDPSQVSQVEDIFADKWRNKASSGWWIQKDGGSWTKK
jgi:uncharacterized protein YdbL (DUF1318 family)